MDNDRLIVRVANAIDYADTQENIRDMLLSEGLSEYDAYLTFRAGEILFSARTKFAMDPRNAHVLEAELAARSMVAERQS